jgi:hypothetical protein
MSLAATLDKFLLRPAVPAGPIRGNRFALPREEAKRLQFFVETPKSLPRRDCQAANDSTVQNSSNVVERCFFWGGRVPRARPLLLKASQGAIAQQTAASTTSDDERSEDTI